MISQVLKIHVEDHVTPVLKAVSEMKLLFTEPLPSLPDPVVVIEQSGGGRRCPAIRMMPSPEILDWLATVRRQCSNRRAYLVTAPYGETKELDGAQVEALSGR